MLRKNQHVKCAQILSKSPKSQKEPKDSEFIKEAKKVIQPKSSQIAENGERKPKRTPKCPKLQTKVGYLRVFHFSENLLFDFWFVFRSDFIETESG